MSDTKESYTDYLRRVADDFEGDGMHATAKDYRESARRIDSLVYRLMTVLSNLKGLDGLRSEVNRELERYGK